MGASLDVACLVLGVLVMIPQYRSIFSRGARARARIHREISYRQVLGARVGQIVASEFQGDPKVAVIPHVVRDSAVLDGFMSAMSGTGTVELLEPDLDAYVRELMQAEDITAEQEEMWLKDAKLFAMDSNVLSVKLMNDLLHQVESNTDVLVLFSALPLDFMELDILS